MILIVSAYLGLRLFIVKIIDGIIAHFLNRHSENEGVKAERHGRLRTVRGLIKSVAEYVLLFVFGTLLMKAAGFDIMPFVTTAGVIGLAIGFGSQKLVKDVISGFFIIVDGLFVVGDEVKIGEATGRVMDLGMRVTKIQDPNGKVYLLSNGDIGMITNFSRQPVEDFIEVALAPGVNMSEVEKVISETGSKLFEAEGNRLDKAPRLLGTSVFTAISVTIRISVGATPRYLGVEQMRVREAMRLAFVEAKILIA